MHKVLKCSSPGCENTILVKDEGVDPTYLFCQDCKKKYSLSMLRVQVDHEKPIREVIMDARIFKTANGMADYIGISFVSLYSWLGQLFKNADGSPMSFQEFRRKYICKSENCYMLNIKRTSYARSDYILKKLRQRSYSSCSCISSLEPGYIMTNCPKDQVKEILRGSPKIVQISDGVFALAPEPFIMRGARPFIFRKAKPWVVNRSKEYLNA